MSSLKHKHYLITRPAHQSASLITQIESEGGTADLLPCIDISNVNNSSTQNTLKQINTFDLCIFTSSNAVTHTLSHKQPAINIPMLAIGPATAAALSKAGYQNIMTGDTINSEGLLSLSILQDSAHKRIAIFTGEDPRPLLKNTLKKRNASVTEVMCYKRVKPTYSEAELKPITEQSFDCIITTSPDALKNLVEIFTDDEQWLLQQNILVISDKMQGMAEQFGFRAVIQTTDVNGIMVMLREHVDPRSSLG